MKRMRWSILASGLGALFAAGCAADTNADTVNDPSSFPGMHKTQIEYDCGEARVCQDSQNAKVPGDFVQTCIEMEADRLVHVPAQQAIFLNAINRCGAFQACEYYMCTLRRPGSDSPSGYGETQTDKITFACQQKIQCESDSGKKPKDAALEINNCIGATTGALFNFALDQRKAYESSFAMCSQAASCAFVSCFPYLPP